MSLFERIEEFSLQEDNQLGLFGLQEDLLDGDLGGALGCFNTDVGQDEGLLKFQQPQQASLESFVIPGTDGKLTNKKIQAKFRADKNCKLNSNACIISLTKCCV